MLPQVADEGLADYIDVFCEQGYFSVHDTLRIIEAGAKCGLKAKVHMNQFTATGGVRACVEAGALTVDHLEELNDDDLAALKSGSTLPVALPGCSHFLRIPFTPGRRIIDAGLPLALATDYNPGSAPSWNMNLVVSLACTHMGLLPMEALAAATVNGAAALDLGRKTGAIVPGFAANFIVTEKVPSLEFLPYAFGENAIASVYINGRKL
jgi:imidazolonepropionase